MQSILYDVIIIFVYIHFLHNNYGSLSGIKRFTLFLQDYSIGASGRSHIPMVRS